MNTISFPKMFNMGNSRLSTNISHDIKSINECLTSLLSVNEGELLGDPTYGTNIRQRLFDIQNGNNIYLLKRDLANAILEQIPEIIVSESSISIFRGQNSNAYKITIRYKIKQSNENGVLEYIVK